MELFHVFSAREPSPSLRRAAVAVSLFEAGSLSQLVAPQVADGVAVLAQRDGLAVEPFPSVSSS